MKSKAVSKILVALFVLCAVFAVASSIYGGIAINTDDVPLNSGSVHSLNTGWYLIENGEKIEIPALPTVISRSGTDSVTLYREMPAEYPSNAVICMESYHQTLRVTVGGRVVYEYGQENKSPVGRLLGNVWNLAGLPEGTEGETLSLELASPYTQKDWHVSDVFMGSRSAVVHKLFLSSLNVIVFCLLSLALGLFFLLLTLLLKIKRLDFNRQGFLYLSLFILVSTVWIATDSKIPQFFFGNKAAIYLLSFFSFMLMPVPFLLYLRNLCRHGEKMFLSMCALFILNFLLCTGLYFAGAVDLTSTLPITHVLMALAIVGSMVVVLRERFHYGNRDTELVIVGIGALFAGALLSLLTFYPQGDSDNSFFFRCGLAAFFGLLCYSTFKRGVRLLRTSMQAETYRELAFSDTMTQLANRAAFDRDAEELQKQETGAPLAVAVFDINNLKNVNDTYGHLAGDRLIRGAADCIRESFGPLGRCYRIGGDEFVVMMRNGAPGQAGQAFERLADCVANCDVGNPDGLNMANGYAAGTCSGQDFVYRLFREADALMYEQKGKRVREKRF